MMIRSGIRDIMTRFFKDPRLASFRIAASKVMISLKYLSEATRLRVLDLSWTGLNLDFFSNVSDATRLMHFQPHFSN